MNHLNEKSVPGSLSFLEALISCRVISSGAPLRQGFLCAAWTWESPPQLVNISSTLLEDDVDTHYSKVRGPASSWPWIQPNCHHCLLVPAVFSSFPLFSGAVTHHFLLYFIPALRIPSFADSPQFCCQLREIF